MCIRYNFTWLTADMCCLSYWSVSKPYFWSLSVLLVFTLVLSANRKGRCKTLLLHFVKTENWKDTTSSCHMGCLQWSTLCACVLKNLSYCLWKIYIRSAFISLSCTWVCFCPVEWWIVGHMILMAAASKTDIEPKVM